VKVYCGEGLAIHISPEPCAAIREGRREASVGITCKPAIVPRNAELDQDAEGEAGPEGNTYWREIASAKMVLRGLRHWRARKPFEWELGEITTDQLCWPVSGRRMRRSR